jgi:hypothetical protein
VWLVDDLAVGEAYDTVAGCGQVGVAFAVVLEGGGGEVGGGAVGFRR